MTVVTHELPDVLETPEDFHERYGSGPCYVVAYALTRHYGGPEEGGWWYDVGTPVDSVRVYGYADACAMHQRLLAIHAPDFEHRRTRFSVIGDADLVVHLSEDPAATWPESRPFYE